MNCPNCNAPLNADSRFCGGCGRASVITTEGDSGGTAADPSSAMLGREIAGRYRIKTKLGEGGMGAVFKAEQISLKRVVALKLLKPELVDSQPLLRRFNAEAEAVAKLNHPNTVGIYDFGQDKDGTLFIAMEYVEGKSLRAMLIGEGPFAPLRALHITGQIAASLSDAHASGIIHRDLKPDNIMLQERGRQRDVVRVLDFGIAKLRDDSRMTQQSMTQAGDVLGTPQYMSPEQIRGEEIDGRADVYSLGAILYEMLTGRMVFDATSLMALLSKHLLDQPEPPSRRRPDLRLSAELDELVMSCLAKEPRARPASMERVTELVANLAQALGGGGSLSSGEVARQPSVAGMPPVQPGGAGGAPGALGTGTGSGGGYATPGQAMQLSPQQVGQALAHPPTPPPMGPAHAGYPPPAYGAPPDPGGYGGYAPHAGAHQGSHPGAHPGAPYAPHPGPSPAYAPYPPQPVSGGHAPAASAPSRAGLWIALALIGLLGAGGAGYYLLLYKKQDAPAEPVVAQPEGPGSAANPWGSGGGSGSGAAHAAVDDDDDVDVPVVPDAPAVPDPGTPMSPTQNPNKPMKAPKIANIGGQLFSASGAFRLLVPPEMSMRPEIQTVPDGSAKRWTFRTAADHLVSISMITSPSTADIDPDDPEATVRELGRTSGMTLTGWGWRDIGGAQKALFGTYEVSANGKDLAAEAVLYIKTRGVLAVLFTSSVDSFEDAKDYRDQLFTQRVSW